MDNHTEEKQHDSKADIKPNYLWAFIVSVNAYDFLAICHLVPTHTLHLSRPYMMSPTPFGIFQNTLAVRSASPK